MAANARISKKTDLIVHEIASMTGKTKIEILEEAVSSYHHKEKMKALNESFAKLKSNKKAWKQELMERKELEGTLLDGLEDY